MPTTPSIKPLPQKPTVHLLGNDGHALAIIGQCQRVCRKAGLDSGQWKVIIADMMSGDYDNLFPTAMAHFIVK